MREIEVVGVFEVKLDECFEVIVGEILRVFGVGGYMEVGKGIWEELVLVFGEFVWKRGINEGC